MKEKSEEKKDAGWLLQLRPVHRFVAALAVAVIVFALLPKGKPFIFHLVGSWISFCITYLGFSWLVIAKMPVAYIREKANREDGSTAYVFALILLAVLASLFAVLMLVINQQQIADRLLLPVAVGSMLLSWCMVHTIFVFHYARMYYAGEGGSPGLRFPGENTADYMDFAYFSFGVGCTFQVADVDVLSKSIRRMVFFHSLLSFLLNTFVVALTINIIAGLIN